jgi:hypothetical protein
VIVICQHVTESLFEVGKIDNHAILRLAFDSDLDLIGVAVKWPALGVSGQKVGAIHVLRHAKPHGLRIA